MPRIAITIDYLGIKGEYIKLHKHQSGDFLDRILSTDLEILDLPPPSQVWIIDTAYARVECYWKVRGDPKVRFIPPFLDKRYLISVGLTALVSRQLDAFGRRF